jgi:uncharacterized SAM-binding protein YcdF (DUF218 family)
MNDVGTELPQPELEKSNNVPKVESPINQEAEKNTLDAILIFGQGPIIEAETRGKAEVVNKGVGSEDINLWSQSLAQAAAELFKRGQTREIIVMGGQTGGKNYLSEADLIARELVEKHGIPENAIKREGRSTNTLENLVNVCNEYLDKSDLYKNLGILTSNYHLSRTELLMELFKIPHRQAFSAEEVMRYVAREGKDWDKWDQNALSEIEKKLDMGTKGGQYFEEKIGEERKNVTVRGQQEDVWSRALLEVPDYWLGYIGNLHNMSRIKEILINQDQKVLRDKFGIDLFSDTDETIKTKLSAIKRKVPSLEEWIGKDWSEETRANLEGFVEKRRQKN